MYAGGPHQDQVNEKIKRRECDVAHLPPEDCSNADSSMSGGGRAITCGNRAPCHDAL